MVFISLIRSCPAATKAPQLECSLMLRTLMRSIQIITISSSYPGLVQFNRLDSLSILHATSLQSIGIINCGSFRSGEWNYSQDSGDCTRVRVFSSLPVHQWATELAQSQLQSISISSGPIEFVFAQNVVIFGVSCHVCNQPPLLNIPKRIPHLDHLLM